MHRGQSFYPLLEDPGCGVRMRRAQAQPLPLRTEAAWSVCVITSRDAGDSAELSALRAALRTWPGMSAARASSCRPGPRIFSVRANCVAPARGWRPVRNSRAAEAGEDQRRRDYDARM